MEKKNYTQRIESFEIDSTNANHAVWAVELVTETADVRRFERLGLISQPVVTTYMDGNVYVSTNAYGADRQMHKTWEDALARFK